MKKTVILMLLFVVLSAISASAQKIDLSKVIFDKGNCTITRKSDGKVFKFSGTFKVVEDYADFEVQIVNDYADAEIRIVDSYPSCCEFKRVNDYPDITVKLVDDYADFTVKIVKDYPYIRH